MKHIRMFEDSQSASQVLSALSYSTLSAIRNEGGVVVNKYIPTIKLKFVGSWSRKIINGRIPLSNIIKMVVDGTEVTPAENYAFGVNGYHTVELGFKDPTTIPEFCFQGITMVEIEFPDTVTSIGRMALAQGSELEKVTIPNSVTSIGVQVIYECNKLKSLVLPDSIVDLNSVAQSCTGITSIKLPSNTNITSIPNQACKDDKKLSSITIPDTVTSIGNQAFYGCSSIASLTIPDTVTTIGSEAFKSVQHIEYHGTATGAPWGASSIN